MGLLIKIGNRAIADWETLLNRRYWPNVFKTMLRLWFGNFGGFIFLFLSDVIKYGTATKEACIGRVSVKPVPIPTIEFDLIVNWNNL